MSYEFEAEPKVVHSRSKYRDNKAPEYGNQSTISALGKENRPKILSPAQQEQEYVRIEKERMKIENMHKQLIAFKKSKKKVSPYEIKPSANPKVDVNLTFFLTDSTDVKPNQTNIDVQTDVFKPRPKSPPYVPKKTGRDVSTQVEDNELFNFDREVTPIIDVIVTKTLEQSVVEIEEETEIERIRTFKGEYWKRRQEDEKKWRAMLQTELDTIATKNKKLEEFRAREERRIHILRKVQTYAVAHKYIRDLNFNTLEYLHNNGLQQNEPQEELINNIPPFMVDGTQKILTEKHKLRDLVANAFTQIEGELMSLREKADKRFKRKQEKRRQKRINYSSDERLVRFVYMDDGTPSTYFARFLSKMQEPELAAFFQDYRTRVNELRDKLRHGDIAQDEYDTTFPADFPELQPPATFRLVLDDLKELSFNVANNMYYSEMPKPGFFDIAVSAFDKDGVFLYQIDKYMSKNTSKSVSYRGSIRDPAIKISDDLGIKVNLNKVEPEVSHLLLTVEIRNLEQSIGVFNELEHSRFRLADYNTGQTVEETNIFQNFKLEELKDTGAESELGGKILAYYLFKTPELGWVVEAVRTFKNVPIETFEQFNQGVLEPYLKICLEEEFKEFEETPDVSRSIQDPSIDKSRSKDYSKGKSSIVPSKIIESKREEEEDQPAGPSFSSRNFGPLHLKITDSVESMQERVDEALKKNEALYSSFEFGYQILVGEHELVRPTQIRKIGPLTSFSVKRKPRPVEDVVIQDTEEEGEGDEEQRSEESDA